jgi:hypothetical protein
MYFFANFDINCIIFEKFYNKGLFMKNSTNSNIKFGIIGAMDVEIEHLCSLMKNKQETEISHLKFFEGKINDKSCVVVQSGI